MEAARKVLSTRERREWGSRVHRLRQRLGLSQSELGRQLNSSAMAVSRWERGVQDTPANINIQLGNLTGTPECWEFWNRAGLHSTDLMRVLPKGQIRSKQIHEPRVEIIRAGSFSVSKKTFNNLVAIPLLPVTAATQDSKGDSAAALHHSAPDSMMAAPMRWCPNPASTSCVKVLGRAMLPLIHSGYILAVDTSQTNRTKLLGQIVIAANNGDGLIVSRLQRFDYTDVLVPENREYSSTPISTGGWRIIAKVLWWIGRPDLNSAMDGEAT